MKKMISAAGKLPALQKAGIAILVAAALLLALGWAVIDRSTALATVEGQTPPTGDGPHPERDARPDAPAISFIDSQTPACFQLDYQRDYCQIEFNYMYVTASTNQYIISMSLRIDNRIRGYYNGFFQNYMYIPSDMHGRDGFTVRCGPLGSGGNPYLGKAYSYTIRARETGGLSSANYGTVFCPAGPRMVHLPLVRKH
jgi:hypothetical protein